MVKNLPALQETRVRSPGREDPPEKGTAIHSSILAWRIPWIEEPDWLQFVGLQRVGHDWVTNTRTHQVSRSVVSDSLTPWTAAHQASLSITNSWSLLKLMSIKSVMPSNHLILCCPLLLLPSILPRIRVFSKESVLHKRWPKYWSFSNFLYRF